MTPDITAAQATDESEANRRGYLDGMKGIYTNPYEKRSTSYKAWERGNKEAIVDTVSDR